MKTAKNSKFEVTSSHIIKEFTLRMNDRWDQCKKVIKKGVTIAHVVTIGVFHKSCIVEVL